MTDYDLIVECKKNDKDAKLALFQRYHYFHLKKYSIFKRKCRSSILSFEEFEAEAYIAFEKAVKYTNLKKLKKPLTWKFIGVYNYYLTTMILNMVTEETKYWEKNDSANVPVNSDDPEERIDKLTHRMWDEFKSPTERKAMEQMFVKQFVDSLKGMERVLFEHAQVLENGKVPSAEVIASRLGYSRAWVSLRLSEIKEKYRAALQSAF